MPSGFSYFMFAVNWGSYEMIFNSASKMLEQMTNGIVGYCKSGVYLVTTSEEAANTTLSEYFPGTSTDETVGVASYLMQMFEAKTHERVTYFAIGFLGEVLLLLRRKALSRCRRSLFCRGMMLAALAPVFSLKFEMQCTVLLNNMRRGMRLSSVTEEGIEEVQTMILLRISEIHEKINFLQLRDL